MLEGIGYGLRVAAGYAPWASAGDAVPARVLGIRCGLLTVLTARGPRDASLGAGVLAALAADAACGPCVGDWVVLRGWPDHRCTVEAVLPRRTTVPGARADDPCLANVDVLVRLGDARSQPTPPRGVDVVDLGGEDDVEGLRRRLAAGETLAVAGGDERGRRALLRRLAGTALLLGDGAATRLLPVPGGGALVDLPGAPSGDTTP